MKDYTKDELEQALEAISSTIRKIEKIFAKKTLGTSQTTLIERRLKALHIASDLIAAKMEDAQ